MNKNKHEYFEKTMLEEVVSGMLSYCQHFIAWLAFDVMVIVMAIVIIVALIIGLIMIIASLPTDQEQKTSALDTYHECRNVQQLSEEACLLLALDLD